MLDRKSVERNVAEHVDTLRRARKAEPGEAEKAEIRKLHERMADKVERSRRQ